MGNKCHKNPSDESMLNSKSDIRKINPEAIQAEAEPQVKTNVADISAQLLDDISAQLLQAEAQPEVETNVADRNEEETGDGGESSAEDGDKSQTDSDDDEDEDDYEDDSSSEEDESEEDEVTEDRQNLQDPVQERQNLTEVVEIFSTLQKSSEDSHTLVALVELCDYLSFCEDDNLLASLARPFSPSLINLASHKYNPDIMLYAIRAINCLCDSRSSKLSVWRGAIPVLCQKLMAIEFLDVAEHCLQVLEKISRQEPLPCLEAGAIMAVLNYIDFFSTSVQRTALSIVVNICKELPSDGLLPVMEAVPTLCNLLQYEDSQIVERVATCLIKIAERVCHSSDMLEELGKQEMLIHRAISLIDVNSQTTLSQPVYCGLIGLLAKLASCSVVTVRILFERDISNILKDILSTDDLSRGVRSADALDGLYSQVHEVLKLLNKLLPATALNLNDDGLNLEKRNYLVNQPDLLQKFGTDLLPMLIQVVNGGANLYVCYEGLSVIHRFICACKCEMLLDLQKWANISSFLAELLTSKDQHIVILALQIVDTILQKLPDSFLNSFVKEGVSFSIQTLLKSGKGSHFEVPVSSDVQPPRCLCYAFCTDSKRGSCTLEADSAYNLASQLKINYFDKVVSRGPEKGMTDVLWKLRSLAATLTNLVNEVQTRNGLKQHEERIYSVLQQIMAQICGRDSISTFEFIESGIVKALVTFLSKGDYLGENTERAGGFSDSLTLLKPYEIFAAVLFSTSEGASKDYSPLVLTQKLQTALSAMEKFPVVLSHAYKQKKKRSRAVPHENKVSYPCLEVQFIRAEGETCLVDYSDHVLSVDPFSSLYDIEEYLLVRVGGDGSEYEQEETPASCTSSDSSAEGMKVTAPESVTHDESAMVSEVSGSSDDEAPPKLSFYLEGQQLDPTLSLYQAILEHEIKADYETVDSEKFWSRNYRVTYKKASGHCQICYRDSLDQARDSSPCAPCLSTMIGYKIFPESDMSSPVFDVLYLLQVLEGVNRSILSLVSHERLQDFAELKIDTLNDLKVTVSAVPKHEFVNSKFTEKLERQLQDPLALTVSGMPSWYSKFMYSSSFLFGFEARCKYFRLAAFGHLQTQNAPRQKYMVKRSMIMEYAASMMDLFVQEESVLEVRFDQEVGTGLGPTLEFFTLVSHEFQRTGLGMWRGDHQRLPDENSGMVSSPCGLFPRPWSLTSEDKKFAEVTKKFVLLGQVMGKALKDGRLLDIPFSKAFYKLILGQELNMHDINSFDPELYTAMLEFQAVVERKRYFESISEENMTSNLDLCFHNTKIEDLCLEFSLPGYPDYILTSKPDSETVNMKNLEEYVSLIVDATLNAGIHTQMEAFKSGFDQVFPIKHLEIFAEEELEHVICGEHELWTSNKDLDHIKFDHGYTASCPPIINLLEIICEFEQEEHRAFVQFVTGSPRLPRGGLASLNPKLTVVRKETGMLRPDDDFPSVMTCANYLKLPPYSSKEAMKKKLLYAITEGQESFNLS